MITSPREVAMRLEVVGADMVEVIPTSVGSAGINVLAADRIVREILGGIAMYRRGMVASRKDRKEKEEG